MPTDDRPATGLSHPAVLALMLACFTGTTGSFVLGPFLPVLADELATSVALLGQIPALMMLLATLLGLVIGPVADRIGHRRTLLVGLATIVLSTLGIGLAFTIIGLLLATVIGAGGRASIVPVTLAILGRLNEAPRLRAMRWVQTGISASVIVGIPLMAFLAGPLGWRGTVVLLAALTAVILLAVRQTLAPDPPAGAPLRLHELLTAYRPFLGHRPTLGLIASSLLGSVGFQAVATYLGAFGVQQHGLSVQQVGWLYLVSGVSYWLGTQLIGQRLRRLPQRPVVVIGRVVSGLLVSGALALPVSIVLATGLIGLCCLAVGVSIMMTTLLLIDETPAGQATTMTLNGAAFSLGAALGSAIGGGLLALGGFVLVGLGAFAFSLAAAGAVWWSAGRGIEQRQISPAVAAPDGSS